jgi:hypothetical protein
MNIINFTKNINFQKFQHVTSLDKQYFILILLAISTLFSLLINNSIFIEWVIGMVFFHSCFDFYDASLEMKIHHGCVMTIIIFEYIFNVPFETHNVITIPLLWTEISSIFYSVRHFLLRNKQSNLIVSCNDVLFFASFFYLRVINFWKQLVFHPILYDNMSLYNFRHVVYTAIYILFTLNLYWFSIITRKLVKMLMGIFRKECWLLISEGFTSFSYFFSFIACLYLYSPHFPYFRYFKYSSFLLETLSVGLLSISSNRYHHSVYKAYFQLKKEEQSTYLQYNCLSHPIISNYMLDIVCIHLRSFSSLFNALTSYLAVCQTSSSFYFFASLGVGSFLFHIVNMFFFIDYIFQLKSTGEKLELFPEKKKSKYDEYDKYDKYDKIDRLNLYPIFLDIVGIGLILYQHPSSFPTSLYHMFLHLVMAISTMIQPFLYLNHAWLHCLLFMETICLCFINNILVV